MGYFRMYVEHPTLADTRTRFQYLLPIPLCAGLGRYTNERHRMYLCQLLFSMAVCELCDSHTLGNSHSYFDNSNQNVPVYEVDAIIWNGLAGLSALVGSTARIDLPIQLW